MALYQHKRAIKLLWAWTNPNSEIEYSKSINHVQYPYALYATLKSDGRLTLEPLNLKNLRLNNTNAQFSPLEQLKHEIETKDVSLTKRGVMQVPRAPIKSRHEPMCSKRRLEPPSTTKSSKILQNAPNQPLRDRPPTSSSNYSNTHATNMSGPITYWD